MSLCKESMLESIGTITRKLRCVGSIKNECTCHTNGNVRTAAVCCAAFAGDEDNPRFNFVPTFGSVGTYVAHPARVSTFDDTVIHTRICESIKDLLLVTKRTDASA